jgi:hypothetical protein
MQVSIKVVVACLLLTASISTSILPQIDAVLRLQRDAMSLVVQASSSGIDQVHFVVSQRLRRIESACRVLQKVTETQSDGRIMTHGDAYDVSKLIEWLGGTVTAMDVGAGFLYDADGAGAYIDPRVKSLATGPKLPGFIHVILNAVDHLDIGQFNLMTQRPANASAPWARLYEPLWLEYFAIFKDEMRDENHTRHLRWSRLTPVNSGSKWECSFVFGGVTTLKGVAVVPRRYVYFVLRGSWLSAYFSTVAISKAGAAVLVDTVSGAFVAGNIADPTGRQSSSGRATLMPVADLRDIRIAPVLAAEVLDSMIGATSGLEELMACSTPCSYVYWPHSNTLAVGFDGGGVYPTSVATLYHDFVVVRVVQVNGDIDDSADDAPPLMNLRLIVTVPSTDVVGPLLGTIRISMWFAVVMAVVVSVVVLVLVSLTFRGLSDAEEELLRMSSVFGNINNVCDVQTDNKPSQEVTADSLTTRKPQESVFAEVNGILRSIAALSRELRMLRAYAPLPSVFVTANSTPMDEAVNSLSRPVASHSDAIVNEEHDGSGAPYDPSHRLMWKVPVTTVVFRRCLPPLAVAQASAPGGIMSEHLRLNFAVSVIVNCMSQIPGCSIDVFGGDSMVVHFNAKARCSNHALVAINTVRRCISMIANADALINDMPSSSGMADAVGEAATTTTPAECGSINGHSATLSSIGGRHQIGDDKNNASRGADRSHPSMVHFGVSTMLSLCGLMGPPALRAFTVVSAGQAHAAMASRVAQSLALPVVMTWRAVDVAMRQQTTSAQHEERAQWRGQRHQPFHVVDAARVVLPGETHSQVSVMYALVV